MLASVTPLVFSDGLLAALFSLAFCLWIAMELRWLWLGRAHGSGHNFALALIVFPWLGLWTAALLADRAGSLSLEPGFAFVIVGLLVVCLGLLLRRSAERAFDSLGRNRGVGPGDPPGPYRYIRHPAFTASLLTMLGFGLVLSNWASLCLCVFVPLIGYLQQISVAESTLAVLFGSDYRHYARSTARLVPGVW